MSATTFEYDGRRTTTAAMLSEATNILRRMIGQEAEAPDGDGDEEIPAVAPPDSSDAPGER